MDINTEKEQWNKELEATNKELEHLLAHKKEVENKIREIEKAERQKFIEERDREAIAIINAAKAFNEKYGMEVIIPYNEELIAKSEDRKTDNNKEDNYNNSIFPWWIF